VIRKILASILLIFFVIIFFLERLYQNNYIINLIFWTSVSLAFIGIKIILPLKELVNNKKNVIMSIVSPIINLGILWVVYLYFFVSNDDIFINICTSLIILDSVYNVILDKLYYKKKGNDYIMDIIYIICMVFSMYMYLSIRAMLSSNL